MEITKEIESDVSEKHKKSTKVLGRVSGYNIFFIEMKKEFPESNFGDTCRLAASKWVDMTSEEKEKYMILAQERSSELKPKINDSEQKYECSKCGKKFNQHGYYRTHKSDCGKTYICEICGKTLHASRNIKKHLEAVHGKVKHYKCPLCPKEYSYRKDLDRHVICHTDKPKPYECEVCHKKFAYKSNLIRHQKRIVHKESVD